MDNGEIVHAVTGATQGSEVFYELMHWTEASSTASKCDTFPDRTIEASTMLLLMEGTRQGTNSE